MNDGTFKLPPSILYKAGHGDNINIKSMLDLLSGNGYSYSVSSSFDSNGVQTYNIKMQECPRTKPSPSPTPSPTSNPSEGTGKFVSKLQLEDFFTQIGHFQANAVTDTMVKDLNRVLEKYEINTPEKIAIFMATIGHESKTALVEGGVGGIYVIDDVDYRGGGYSQLTGYKYNYKPFADQMEREGLVALNPDGSNPITSLGGGAEYIANHFAWESAGWHWTAQGNIINARIDRGEDFYKISQVINGGPSYTGVPNGWNERNLFYGIAQSVFN